MLGNKGVDKLLVVVEVFLNAYFCVKFMVEKFYVKFFISKSYSFFLQVEVTLRSDGAGVRKKLFSTELG